jgi:hypothetical protein
MDGTAGHAPLGTDHSATKITLVRRPDRRQIPTRRAHFRGGRRAEDFAEELPSSNVARSSSDGSVGAQGSAIVMGWEPRRGTLRRAAGSY